MRTLRIVGNFCSTGVNIEMGCPDVEKLSFFSFTHFQHLVTELSLVIQHHLILFLLVSNQFPQNSQDLQKTKNGLIKAGPNLKHFADLYIPYLKIGIIAHEIDEILG